MKLRSLLVVALLLMRCSHPAPEPDSKTLLIGQLRNTYSHQDWFVPLQAAIQELSAEKVNRKDSTGNHSIGELVSHIAFWNERILIAFEGNTPPDFDNNNESTFLHYQGKGWEQTLGKLDSIQRRWEKAIGQASDSQLNKWQDEIANMCNHTAYHTGQIIYIRRQQGWWDGSKGVK